MTAPARPRQRTRRKPLQVQKLSSYLTFGAGVTTCICVFIVIYALILAALTPLLHQEAPQHEIMKHGEVLKPVVDPIVEKMKHMPHVPGQVIAEGVAGVIKKKLRHFRESKGVTDESLMALAAQEMDHLRQARHETSAKKSAAVENNLHQQQNVMVAPGKRSGFLVLGMHRSGTSMLSGLLVSGAGYNVGGPLIGSAADNEKGFFELVPVVLQNDAFMKKQRVWWSSGVINYKSDVALEHKKEGTVSFVEGEKALKFLNNPLNSPWLQKDPRMCITLPTWLPLLHAEPAVVFTYRHPVEVALSLKRREKNFTLEHGLRLWIIYNMRAIQNSAGLCRVLSSNEAILSDPLVEVQRIADELTNTCGVPAPLRRLEKEDVEKFVDLDLQHNTKQRELGANGAKGILADHDGCVVKEFKSDVKEGEPGFERTHTLYIQAMKIFCDFKSGKAYEKEYQWPQLP